MRRRLSSAQTFLMKFVLPTMWLGGFAGATVLSFKWLFLGATILGGLSLYWSCMRLKWVAIDEQWLYVSNYFREIRIPLRDIEDVSENRWINIRPVTVGLRRETEFGARIIFMPKVRWRGFWRAHPVVGELEQAAGRVRGLPPKRPAA